MDKDFIKELTNLNNMYTEMANSMGNPSEVYCEFCGKVTKINAAECLEHGWPECCGFTMRLNKKESKVE